ncbi:MAG: hypothetical protein U0871_26980 [Gemmataceae bacterium]
MNGRRIGSVLVVRDGDRLAVASSPSGTYQARVGDAPPGGGTGRCPSDVLADP